MYEYIYIFGTVVIRMVEECKIIDFSDMKRLFLSHITFISLAEIAMNKGKCL
jgi:hypothetical protein